MELKEFLAVLGRYLKVTFFLSLAAGLTAFFVTLNSPSKYKATTHLFIQRQALSSGNFFTYEGFYAIQTAEKFTDTIVGLLKSENIKRAALVNMGIPFNARSLARLERALIVKRAAPQVVSLSLTSESMDYSQSMAVSLAETVMREASELNQSSDPGLTLEFVVKDPKAVVIELKPNAFLFGFAAFAASAVLLNLFFAFKDYMKN